MPSPQNREAVLFALALEKPAAKPAACPDAECEGGCGVIDVAEQTEPVPRSEALNMDLTPIVSKILPTILLAFLSHYAQAEWSQFRGANASGIAEGDKPPVYFGPQTNLLWQLDIDPGQSSPCIWGDRLFITGSEKGRLKTICVDRAGGKILWVVPVPSVNAEVRHDDNGPATPTPTSDGNRVFVYFPAFGLIAYDFNGAESWRKPLPVPANPYGAASSPVVLDGRLILNCEDDSTNSCVLAVSPIDGSVLWRSAHRALSSTYSTPILWHHDGRSDLMHASSLVLAALDPQTGRDRWFVRGLEAYSHVPTPVLGGGMLFVMSRSIGDDKDPDFVTFLKQNDRNGDGKLSNDELPEMYRRWFFTMDTNGDGFVTADEWEPGYKLGLKADYGLLAVKPGEQGDATDANIVWKHKKGIPQVPSPLYYRGRVYCVQDGGRVSCFQATTGRVLFEAERLGAEGGYFASPIAADGHIYFSSVRGTVTVIEAADELRVLAHNDLSDRLMATPAVANDRLYVRTDKHLWAFGR